MNIYRILIVGVVGIGLFYAFSVFKEMRSNPINSFDRNSEDYRSEESYADRVASEYDNCTQEEFIAFYENALATEGIDYQEFMSAKMLVALGSHRANFDNSAEANYREVANTYFRDNTTEEFLEFARDCNEKYGVNLINYLDESYRRQL